MSMSPGAFLSLRKFSVSIWTSLEPTAEDCLNAAFIMSTCATNVTHGSTGFLCGSTCGLIDFVSHRDVALRMLEKAQWKNERYRLRAGTAWLIALSSFARLRNCSSEYQ